MSHHNQKEISPWKKLLTKFFGPPPTDEEANIMRFAERMGAAGGNGYTIGKITGKYFGNLKRAHK